MGASAGVDDAALALLDQLVIENWSAGEAMIVPEEYIIASERRQVVGKETRLFKSEERKSRSDVGAFLHQLADKILEGQVVLRQGQEEITLQLPQNVILEIQVEEEDKKAKGIQHSLEVEIKWFDDEQRGPLELA
jgi:amphi-Trp domain-containing protein